MAAAEPERLQRAGTRATEYSIRGALACYNVAVLVGLGAAVGVGVVIGLITLIDGRLRIADEAPLTLLVCVSGAIAGWALLQLIGVSTDSLGAVDFIVPALGAIAIATEAWRGRRRTFSELGLHTHSE